MYVTTTRASFSFTKVATAFSSFLQKIFGIRLNVADVTYQPQQALHNKQNFLPIPETEKMLIKQAIQLIADQAIKAKTKAGFRKILTNSELTAEQRVSKVQAGLHKLNNYLTKTGAIDQPENSPTKPNHASLNSAQQLLPGIESTATNKNLSLDYQLTQTLLAWRAQHSVWHNDLLSAAKPKVMLPGFNLHRRQQVPVAELTAPAPALVPHSRANLLPMPITVAAANHRPARLTPASAAVEPEQAPRRLALAGA